MLLNDLGVPIQNDGFLVLVSKNIISEYASWYSFRTYRFIPYFLTVTVMETII